MKGFGILSSIAFAAFAAASNVVDLTPDNFEAEIIESGKPALVEFFAPWCGHCKKLAPIWEELADSFAASKDKVTIAKVDADEHRVIGTRFGVKGFPTLKWFDGKSDTPEDYGSKRELESLQAFVTEKLGSAVKPKVAKKPAELPSEVVVLTDANFESVALDTNKDVLVEFYAPWCGHCKKLAPVYETVARIYKDEPDVVIAKVDADADDGKASAQAYGVTGFPTLKWFPKGSTEPKPFEGGRSESAIIEFINKEAGTFRLPGGGLSELAGRISELDEIVGKYIKGDQQSLKTVTEEVKKAAKEIKGKSAQYYVKTLEKLAETEEHVEKEVARLEKMRKRGGLADFKLDDFKIRENILRVFAGEKEAVEEEKPRDEL